MDHHGTTLVYGGTGAQGSAIVRVLSQRGYRVRALTRSSEKAGCITKLGAEPVYGDLSDAHGLEEASRGCDNVVFTLPLVFDMDTAMNWAENVIRASQSARVKRFVFNASGPIPEEETGVTALDIKRCISALLSESRLPVITLEPTLYMGNLAAPWSVPAIVHEGRVAYPLPRDLKVSWISWESLAEFVAAALERPALSGRSFRVAGPEALAGTDIADAFSSCLRKPVSYFPVPLADFESGLKPVLGEFAAGEIARLYAWFTEDGARWLDPDPVPAREALGVTPQRFSDWIRTVNWTAMANA